MKGILASICALALLGVSTATFPNDLFYHHHPDLVLDTNKNKIANKYSQHQDNDRGRGHYRQSFPPPADAPPSRNLYRGNPGRGSYRNSGGGPPNRANYGNHGNRGRHEPRSIAPVQKLSYNKDGSIKWANKVADTSDQQQDQGQQQQQDQGQQNDQSQGQYNDYYEGNDNYYGNNGNNDNSGNNGNSGNSGNSNYYRGSNKQKQSQQNDYYDSSNSDSGGNHGNDYYQEDQSDQYYDQGNGNQNDYYSGQSNADDYGNNNNDDNGNSKNNNNYNNYNNNNNNNNSNNNNNNQNQNSNNNQNSTTKSKKNVTAGFAGGIRLAGALPDDGYSRGEGTFYDLETRVGSCGKQNKNSELVAALNTEQMGENGRNNPNCGKEIEVIGPSGKSIQVTVVDSCKNCKSGGLDLSPAAYEEIGDFSHGSVPIKWKFV